MANRVAFSGLHLGLSEIAQHHQDLEASLKLYFAAASPTFTARFSGYTVTEVGDELGVRQGEVLHHAEGFSVRTVAGVEEAMGAGVLVGVGEGELVADGVVVEEFKGVADTDVQVGAGNEAGTVEVRAGHDKEIG